MGYCCVRSRSWRYVSVIFTLLMLGIADFCVGRTCRLRGSDLSSVPLPPLCYVIYLLFIVPVPMASLMGRPWIVLCFLCHEIILLYSACLDILLLLCHEPCFFFL